MQRLRDWLAAFAVYRDRRVIAIAVLGFASGLPLALTGQTLQAWLTESALRCRPSACLHWSVFHTR